MSSSMVLVLAVCVSFCVSDDHLNWKLDENALPEMLPKYMHGKSVEEIRKAVLNAYENQLKIVSEYSGHVDEAEYPYAYFKNDYSIPNTRAFRPEAEMVFYNNVVKGLREYKQNEIVLRFAADQIETVVEWDNANIRGNYYYLNATYFDQGKYHIQLAGLKYRANTTFTENTVNYPYTMPNSSISYESLRASFSGNLPEVTDINSSYSLKYFLEDVAFQHIANGVAESIHNNITIAVRQSIKRYIIFQNASYPNTNGFVGSLPTGVHFKVDEISAYGMNQTHLRVKNVYVDMAAKNLTAEIEFNVHKLNGHFALRVDDSKPYTGKGLLNVSRVDATAAVNVLNGKQCNANTVVHDVRVELDEESGLAPEVNQYVAKELAEKLANAFNAGICTALSGMFKLEAGNF